jgi:heme exporter protein D
MDLGPHAVYIWASYAATVLALAGFAAWLALDGRHQRRLLDELDRRGIRRRSDRGREQG